MKNKIDKKEIVLLVDLYNSQKFGECEIEIRKLIKKYTNDEKLFDMLGLTLSAQKKYNESVKCFNQATTIKANYYEAHNNLGNVLLKLGKKQEAINCYLKVIEIKPDSEHGYFNLGNTLELMGQHQEAVSHYHKTIEINPNFKLVQKNLGVAYMNVFEWDEAEKCFLKFFEKKNDIIAQRTLNFINNIKHLIKLEKSGDFHSVIRSSEKIISDNPTKIEPYLYCLKSLIKLKKKNTIKYICKIIKIMGGENILQNFSRKEKILQNLEL